MILDLGGSIAKTLMTGIFIIVIGGVLVLIGKPLAKYLFPMLHRIGIKTTGGIIDYALIGIFAVVVIAVTIAAFGF
jgi:hypothetical protein